MMPHKPFCNPYLTTVYEMWFRHEMFSTTVMSRRNARERWLQICEKELK